MKRALPLLLVAGCHAPPAPPTAKLDVPAVAAAPDSDAVVATVDGRPIRASDVARQARAANQSAKQALDDLVDAEVLAGEARRKQVKLEREAVDEVRAAAVRELMHQDYERSTTVDTVPEREVVRFYNKNRANFDHSVQVDVLHILVPTKGASAEVKAQAKKRIEELARQAHEARSPEAFRALARAPERVEEIQTARDGWTEKSFSEAAFDQLRKPGDTSGVVETSYGYHVLFLLKYVPALHQPVEEVAPRIREHLFPIWRRQHFLEWVAALARTHEVAVHPERLK